MALLLNYLFTAALHFKKIQVKQICFLQFLLNTKLFCLTIYNILSRHIFQLTEY